MNPTNQTSSAPSQAQVDNQMTLQRNSRVQKLKFLGIALVCLAPVLFSYGFYYLGGTSKTTNHGTLLEPQRPAQGLKLTQLDGKPLATESFRKRFVMVTTDQASCNESCAKLLYTTRQIHAMTGKERERVERLWIIPRAADITTQDSPRPDPKLLAAHEGLFVAYADANELNKLLPVAADHAFTEHIFLIDVQGNLMMRYNKQSDPYKVKKDLSILLKAASVR